MDGILLADDITFNGSAIDSANLWTSQAGPDGPTSLSFTLSISDPVYMPGTAERPESARISMSVEAQVRDDGDPQAERVILSISANGSFNINKRFDDPAEKVAAVRSLACKVLYPQLQTYMAMISSLSVAGRIDMPPVNVDSLAENLNPEVIATTQ